MRREKNTQNSRDWPSFFYLYAEEREIRIQKNRMIRIEVEERDARAIQTHTQTHISFR